MGLPLKLPKAELVGLVTADWFRFATSVPPVIVMLPVKVLDPVSVTAAAGLAQPAAAADDAADGQAAAGHAIEDQGAESLTMPPDPSEPEEVAPLPTCKVPAEIVVPPV